MKIFGWLSPKPKPPLPPPGPAPDAPGTVRDWTVLVYGAGNVQDLDYDISSSVKSFGALGTDSKVAFAAQVASHKGGGQQSRKGRRAGENRHGQAPVPGRVPKTAPPGGWAQARGPSSKRDHP